MAVQNKRAAASDTKPKVTKRKFATTKPPIASPKMIITGVPKDLLPQIARIASSQRTGYEKRVWTALCQIPKGHFTTYGLLSAHLGSSPRAVGNALRRNPFAPEVPCHRVVATGGNLGGFKGKWPKDGEGITLDEKRMLLRGEGIKFDEKGKVLGSPWVGFPKEAEKV